MFSIHFINDFQLTEANEKLKTESENCSRLRKQVSELTVLLASKEQSLNDKINSLKEGKDFLELELAKVRLALDKEESVRQQTADLQTELEKRTQALQSELAKTRDRENKIIEDNQTLLEKLVHAEKSSASLELQLKGMSFIGMSMKCVFVVGLYIDLFCITIICLLSFQFCFLKR
jgi:chromosome segregation ATPase